MAFSQVASIKTCSLVSIITQPKKATVFAHSLLRSRQESVARTNTTAESAKRLKIEKVHSLNSFSVEWRAKAFKCVGQWLQDNVGKCKEEGRVVGFGAGACSW